MVNGGMVNGGTRCAIRADFRENLLLFLADFHKLQNPIKYNGNLPINRNLHRKRPGAPLKDRSNAFYINTLASVKPSVKRLC